MTHNNVICDINICEFSFSKDGSYVVRNDRTRDIVQVSDKFDKDWKAPWE
ncbi:colicin E5-related ribonuclease [Desulfovibrio litoralis]|uniref:Colicin E5 ribonuclease domain-containing protein n=1 Tax=Desulfovibrio litoralis DSM 11393 TaxID=1121455 RepID=A0A1M7TGS2_9BACT|nr:hypothetical protein SAMN02745728_01979 [Desulfovibrio litoralis DSM 11393]